MAQKSYIHKPATKPMDYRTLAQLHDYHTGLHPQDEAFVIYDSDEHRSVYTFQEVKDQSLEIAGLLLQIGITRGQRVALMAPNCIEFISCFLALNRIGANAILIPLYGKSEKEVISTIQRLKCKSLLAFPSGDKSYDQKLMQNAVDILDVNRIINIGSKHGTFQNSFVKTLQDLRTTLPKMNDRDVYKHQEHVQFDDPAVVLFTSGSTGESKSIQYTHHAVANEAFAIMMYWFGLSIDEVKSGKANVRLYIDRPFTYSSCFFLSLNNMFAIGCTVVSIPVKAASKRGQTGFILRVLQNEKCTHGTFFPYLIHDLIIYQNTNKFDLESLKTILVGGQVIPKEHLIQLKKILPNCVLMYGYGMSEVMSVAGKPFDAFSDSYDGLNVNPTMEIKIINDNKEVVPVGEKGEICVRCRSSFSQYLEYSNKQVQGVASNGWIHTDDAGYIDHQGQLHVCGRMHEVIIRGARKVYPVEVEKVLSTHPDVKSVVVIGVPDERLNEEICACVILKAGSGLEFSMTEFEAWASLQWETDDLGLTRKQKYTLVFQAFPLTKTGKTNRKALKAIAVEKLGLDLKGEVHK